MVVICAGTIASAQSQSRRRARNPSRNAIAPAIGKPTVQVRAAVPCFPSSAQRVDAELERYAGDNREGDGGASAQHTGDIGSVRGRLYRYSP